MTAPTEVASWDLVAAAQAGDRDAFGQLWTRYRTQIARVVGKRVGDRGTVEDIVSDTFLKAWRNIRGVEDQGLDVAAWLTRIALNLVADHYKASARRTYLAGASVDTEVWAPPTYVENADLVSADGVSARLEGLLSDLPLHYAEVIRCRFYRGLSLKAAEQFLGLTEQGLRGRQHRAVVALRRTITDTGITSAAQFVDTCPDRPARTYPAPQPRKAPDRD